MKKTLMTIFGAGLLAAASVLSFSHNSNGNATNKIKEVSEGRIEYNKGPLISHGFYGCSAVILDFGEEALMAHAYPQRAYGRSKHRESDLVGYDTVVTELVEDARRRGLDLKHARAFVNFGEDSSRKKIMSDLFLRGIYVAHEEFNREKDRVIHYDPKHDSMTVYLSGSN